MPYFNRPNPTNRPTGAHRHRALVVWLGAAACALGALVDVAQVLSWLT